MPDWSFAVLSDVHVFMNSRVPTIFTTVVNLVLAQTPRFVVVSGDSTVGNPSDGVGAARVQAWWEAFQGALRPLRAAGIPVLVIAGNHDYYTKAHRDGYVEAWKDLASDVADLALLGGHPPLYYSCDIDGVHLVLLHAVDTHLEPTVEAWLRADLTSADASAASLRLCIGHVPLISIMGKTSASYRDHLGSLLAEANVAAYFSGHEHLVWDEELTLSTGSVRQVLVGTASGTYHYPLSADVAAKHVRDRTGTLPYTGQKFSLIPGTRQQADKVNVTFVDITGSDYAVRPLTLRAGALAPFGD